MATTTITKLSMTYSTADGDTTISFNYAKDNITTQQVQTLSNVIITNGAVFSKVPLTLKAAKVVTTETTPFDLE